MNTVEFIQALKVLNHLSESEADKIVTLFLDKMAEALSQGDRAENRGLRSLSIKNTRGPQDVISMNSLAT